MTSVTLQDSPQKRNSLPMLMLVVSLMAMPVIIAAGLYFIGWQPERTGNQGHLVSPPQPLPASGLKTTDGSPLATGELHGKWLLLLSGNGQCVASCVQRLDEMRRIQVSLRRDMGRLRRVVLTDQVADPQFVATIGQQPDLALAVAPPRWLPNSADESGYLLHIIDPRGHLIMTYPADITAKGVQGDLERLLRYAWNG
ncbi:MAG: hypothetical protein JNK92_07370 [Dechloromonas sp.]|nr:hypothetical protein [Dechloromonas sp.]